MDLVLAPGTLPVESTLGGTMRAIPLSRSRTRISSTSVAALLALGLPLGPACNCGVEQLETPRPRMIVDPEEVNIASAPVAQDTRIVIQIHNPSIVNLTGVEAELVDADVAFELREAPQEVLPAQTEEVVIVVRPRTVTTLNATLVLTAAEPARPARVEVPIVVTSVDAGVPDICDYPESIQFAGVGRNSVGRASVDVRNCGVRDLLLDEVFFCPTPGDGEPTDPAHPECGLDTSITLTSVVAPGTPVGPQVGASLQLIFQPTDLVAHRGNLVIRSNDPDENPVVIPVDGTGADCPTAVATLVDDPESIEPFDTVRIDGRDSIPAGGVDVGPPIEEYQWSIVQRPVGSTAVLSSDSADRVELPVDLAGGYVVQLHVVDTAGIRSCEPAIVEIPVVPTEELLVQLVWDHDSADLDVHLVRAGGTPFTHEDDCYFSNREPSGPPWSDVPEQNPVLDHDDSRGYGPENVNIVAPAPGSRWQLLVHYWNKQTDRSPRTEATVRVFVYGQQVIEVSRTFEDDQQLWQALDITWPEEEGAPASISQIGVLEPFARPF